MYNDLFSIGPLTVHSYGVMIAIGVLAAVILSEKRANKNELNGDATFNAEVIGLLAGLIGAKLTFVIANFKEFIESPKTVLGTEGFVVMGGVLIGVLVGFLILRKADGHKSEYLDVVIPQVPLAQGFGRIGCFLAGCCYGKPTHAWFGVIFPEGSVAPAGIPLIPTQLISSAADFILFAVLILISRKKHSNGTIVALYFILYGIGRFFMEMMRWDDRTHLGALTSNQIVCLVLVAAGIGAVIYLAKKKPFGVRTLK